MADQRMPEGVWIYPMSQWVPSGLLQPLGQWLMAGTLEIRASHMGAILKKIQEAVFMKKNQEYGSGNKFIKPLIFSLRGQYKSWNTAPGKYK